jgi:hypothetical protein
MKFKILPEPVESIETVAEMQAAVPLVPDEEESCCARLIRRTDLGSQDHAKEWLTFLRALELVEETDGKFRRTRRKATPEALRESYRERVYLAEDTLEALADADDPLDCGVVFDRLGDRLPQWERLRHTDPEDIWRERVARILEWTVVFGLVERADGGYAIP